MQTRAATRTGTLRTTADNTKNPVLEPHGLAADAKVRPLYARSQNGAPPEVSARDALAQHTRMFSRYRALGVHSTYRGCCPRLVSQSSLMEFAMSRVL